MEDDDDLQRAIELSKKEYEDEQREARELAEALRLSSLEERPVARRQQAAQNNSNTATVGLLQVERTVGLQLDLNAYVASILCDKSGSMAGSRDRAAIEGLRKIVSQFTQHDLMNCIAFNSKAVEVSDFLSNQGEAGRLVAVNRLRDIKPSGNTALYDAIALATIGLARLWPFLHASNEGARVKHRCLMIILTDGEDTASEISLDQCTELIREIVRITDGECRFIFIGVQLDGTGRAHLEHLKRAGGESSEFYNSREMDLDTIFDRIAASIRVSYNVNYAELQVTSDSSPFAALWRAMNSLHEGVKPDFLGDDLRLARPTTLEGFYEVLQTYEASLSRRAQTVEFTTERRRVWLRETNDHSKYSPAHFASCLFMLERGLQTDAQDRAWLENKRDDFIQQCVSLGAYNIS